MEKFFTPKTPESDAEKQRRIHKTLNEAFDSVSGEGIEIKGLSVVVTRKLKDGSIEIIQGLLVWSMDANGVLFTGKDPDSNAATML